MYICMHIYIYIYIYMHTYICDGMICYGMLCYNIIVCIYLWFTISSIIAIVFIRYSVCIVCIVFSLSIYIYI